MSDLHDARVEEIAEVMADINGEPRVGRYERTLATVALKNADALLTVEMIADAIWQEQSDRVRSGYVIHTRTTAETTARAVLALIRGGGER